MAMWRFVSLALLLGAINEVQVLATSAPPIKKAIAMVTDLRDKLAAEGEEEAQTYNTFACFCKDTMASKGAAISEAASSKSTLEADMNAAALARDSADTARAQATSSMNQLREEIENLTATRHAELMAFDKAEIDLTAAVQGLDGAIQSLKAAKVSATFLELPPVVKTVQRALASLSSLESSPDSPLQQPSLSAASLQLLQQLQAAAADPSDAHEDYSFHADDIVGTLENLRTQFKSKKQELGSNEAGARQAYEKQVQAKESSISTHESDAKTEGRSKASAAQRVADASKDLSAVSAQLIDDKQFLTSLSAKCNEKAKQWDDRTDSRAAELAGLTAALQVLGQLEVSKFLDQPSKTLLLQEASTDLAQLADMHYSELSDLNKQDLKIAAQHVAEERRPVGSEAVLAQLGDMHYSELSEHEPMQDWRLRLAQALRRKASQLHSVPLLQLAKNAEQDPFAKVKILVQSLIERLLKEAAEEANHKGWCDKEVALAEQSRDKHSESLKELNSQLDIGEARHAQLAIFLTNLENELDELNSTLSNTTELRAKEESEHEAAIKEAKEAKAAVAEVIDILNKYYGEAKNNANDKASLQQASATTHKSNKGFLQVIKTEREAAFREANASNVEACPTGYDFNPGDIKGWGKVNGKGGGESVLDCVACAQLCDSESGCLSFECSHTALKCNLNAASSPSSGLWGDYTFCSKVRSAAEPGAAEEVPDAGFDGAYGGAQGAGEGVIGMLEVIQSDFESTVSETQKLEEAAAREFNELETTMKSSQAEKEVIKTEREAAFQAANASNVEAWDKMKQDQSELTRVIGELLALQSACFPKAETAAERKVKRDEEMAALRNALCILNAHGSGSAEEC